MCIYENLYHDMNSVVDETNENVMSSVDCKALIRYKLYLVTSLSSQVFVTTPRTRLEEASHCPAYPCSSLSHNREYCSYKNLRCTDAGVCFYTLLTFALLANVIYANKLSQSPIQCFRLNYASASLPLLAAALTHSSALALTFSWLLLSPFASSHSLHLLNQLFAPFGFNPFTFVARSNTPLMISLSPCWISRSNN